MRKGGSGGSADVWWIGVSGWGSLIPQSSHGQHQQKVEPSPAHLLFLPVLAALTSCPQVPAAPGAPTAVSSSPQELLTGGNLAVVGFLPCSWHSCLLTGTSGILPGSWVPPCLAWDVLPLQASFFWGLLLLQLMASSGSCLCPTQCELLPGKCLCHLLGTTSSWSLLVGDFWGVRTIPQMPHLWFPCCSSSSLLHILSLVGMAESCFSALLLPFPYLKVIIFSHQSSLNLNKPNSFPGRSCFLDLITFFLWILSRALALQLWICTAEQSRRKIPWACNFSSLQRKSAICKFRISWFALICSLPS